MGIDEACAGIRGLPAAEEAGPEASASGGAAGEIAF
jgi:hypothetical protein